MSMFSLFMQSKIGVILALSISVLAFRWATLIWKFSVECWVDSEWLLVNDYIESLLGYICLYTCRLGGFIIFYTYKDYSGFEI